MACDCHVPTSDPITPLARDEAPPEAALMAAPEAEEPMMRLMLMLRLRMCECLCECWR